MYLQIKRYKFCCPLKLVIPLLSLVLITQTATLYASGYSDLHKSRCLSTFKILAFQQKQIYKGMVLDANGNSVAGATVEVKQTGESTITDGDGKFSIEAQEGDVLIFNYEGTDEAELTLGNQLEVEFVFKKLNNTPFQLKGIELVGIRKSSRTAIQKKKNAAVNIEFITPQDLGNFSDETVTDALERTPGVQVQRNESGIRGNRVSIRGLGNQFVVTTINGRQSISGGNQGSSQFRQFNQGVLPTEVLNGAEIIKSTVANQIEGGIGGVTNYRTIKPLKTRYRSGRNFFGALTIRHSQQSGVRNDGLNPRVSFILGGRTKDKSFGAYVSILSSEEERLRTETGLISGRNRLFDLQVDSNQNGEFNPSEGDETIENVLLTPAWRLNSISETTERFALASGIEYKPIKGLDVNLDLTYFKRDVRSERYGVQRRADVGGVNSIFNANTFFQPNSFLLSPDNVLLFYDGAQTNTGTRTQYILEERFFNLLSEDIITGLNINYKHKEWVFWADISYSSTQFGSNQAGLGSRRSPLITNGFYDARGDNPPFFLSGSDTYLDPASYAISGGAGGNYSINEARNTNFSSRIDISKKIGERLLFNTGYRYSASEIRSRSANRALNFFDDQNPNRISNLQNLVDNNSSLSRPFFSDFNIGDRQFPQLNIDQLKTIYGDALRGNLDPFFENGLFDTLSFNGLELSPNALDFDENTLAFYSMLILKSKRTAKLSGNVGLRIVNTQNTSSAFSTITFIDPIDDGLPNEVQDRIPTTTENSRWDVLPSFNVLYKFSKRAQSRFSIARTITRPSVRDLLPRNTILAINPNSAVANPNAPSFDPNDPSSSIRSGVSNLDPYFSWNIDASVEYYTKSGGAFIFGGFYKYLDGYILNRIQPNEDYPGEDVLGVSIPEVSQQFPFTITSPVNVTDAQVYGFEVGLAQNFKFLPSPWDGLGARVNYTRIQSEFNEDINDAEEGFPNSSKNSYNGIVYYDKYGIGIRFTYAWRGDYLRVIGDPEAPIERNAASRFTEAMGTFGLRLSYTFKQNLQLSVSGSNITGEDRRDYFGNSRENLFAYYQLEPTWIFGVRYRL